MDVKDKGVQDWLDALVPKIAKSIGKCSKKLSYEMSVPDDSFFVSSLFFLTLKIAGEDDVEVVVKKVPFHVNACKSTEADILFHNELLFYRSFAKYFDNYPKYICGDERPPRDTFIVLENVKHRGYKTPELKIDVPLEYALAAMREIGRFHAKGYILKETREEEFVKLLKDIRDVRFEVLDETKNGLILLTNHMAPRAVRHLRKMGYDPTFCDKVEPVMEKAFFSIFLEAAKPAEPLSTLCHGDFNMNNILFRGNAPADLRAMLIDYAMIRYGTPAIDLTTFIVTCCTRDDRKHNLELILRAYHDSLMECLRAAGIGNLQRFSYETVYEDYKRKALFGFLIATFLIPICRGLSVVSAEEMFCVGYAKLAVLHADLGGDEMSQTLADLLLELKEFGSLDHILQGN